MIINRHAIDLCIDYTIQLTLQQPGLELWGPTYTWIFIISWLQQFNWPSKSNPCCSRVYSAVRNPHIRGPTVVICKFLIALGISAPNPPLVKRPAVLFIIILECILSTHRKKKVCCKVVCHVTPTIASYISVFCISWLHHFLLCMIKSHVLWYSNMLYNFVAWEQ